MAEDETKDYGTWSHTTKVDVSRRQFIKTFAGASAAAAVLSQPGANALADWAESGNGQTEIDLPTDILSAKELEETYRTKIHDLSESEFPSNYVELYFRGSVGETPLFKRLKDGDIIGLDVILINHSSVDPDYLTPSQRDFMEKHPTIKAGLQRQVEKVREANAQEIDENRERMQVEYRNKLMELEDRGGNLSPDQLNVEQQALEYSYGRYLSGDPSEQDLRELAIRGYASMSGTATNDRGENGPRSFLFLAVRDKEKTVTFTSGEESLTISSNRIPYRSDNSVYTPNPEQSYPTQDNFEISSTPDELGYIVVDRLTPGFILRHEMRHAQGTFNEESADRGALEGIVEAANHMAETGSDEKYWAVFHTPQGTTITKNVQDSTA